MSQSVILVALSQPAVGLAIKLEVRQGSTPQEPRQRMSASQVFSLQFSYGPDESSCSSSNLIRVDFTSVDSSACSVGDPPCLAVTNTPQFGSLQKRSCVPSLQLALGFNESYAVVTQFSDAICGSLSLTGGFAVPIGVCSPRMASPALLSFASSVKADLVSTNSVTGRLQHFTFSDSSCSTTAINTVQFDTNNKACDQQSSIKFFPVSLSPQAQSSPPVTTASFSAPMIVASSTVPPAQSTNNAIIFSESNGPSLALIIGVSVGGTVFLIIIVSLTVICFLQHRRQKQHAHSSYSLHRHIPSETSESAPLVPLTHLSLYGTRAATPPSLPPVDRASPIPERYSIDQPDLSVLSFYTTRSLKAEIEANPQQQEVCQVSVESDGLERG
ncbi:hypothetical protein BC830DRAFT_462922 [Chytriomyces sp. MP71]|nr:hypothetical protein BC830DRAFT_462922 [Chytriomyces sp. MP71]